MELLAPAGDLDCLTAALEAGADAVYLGLEGLNARRRARNFGPDEFASAVAAAHALGKRAYLTLNIDLAERELGEAARSLELAAACKADAVLVRDLALWALRPAFPELEFHLSTQACAANSEDVRAAKELGACRAVLARELSLREIAACAGLPGLGVEVFVQGALCCSVSGRCLLSSWAGGRSGNRGACTSPCRVPWTVDGEPAGTPLSMKDLAAWDRLESLAAAGVTALKIEGRLKSPDWVRAAVSAYRRALAGEEAQGLRVEIDRLGGCTGREQTSAYLDGKREGMTGVWGRRKGEESSCSEAGSDEPEAVYDLDIEVGDKSLSCTCKWAGRSRQWSQPKTKVVRQAKAVSLAGILKDLSEKTVQGLKLGSAKASEPGLLLPPRAGNALKDQLSIELRLLRKEPQAKFEVSLRAEARELLAKPAPSPENRLCLGQAPDRLRLEVGQLPLMRGLLPAGGAVVEGLKASDLDGSGAVIPALPQVFFEADVPRIKELLERCRQLGLPVEVNSLGGWHLAKQAGVKMEGGPGLSVLNSLAAKKLLDMGLRSVSVSLEIDHSKLVSVSQTSPAPLSLAVYGRPPLITTRARLDAQWLGKVFADRRGIRMRPRVEGGLWVFRPVQPFDWRGLSDAGVRARHLVMDLVGAPDPASDLKSPPGQKPFLFNYDRCLA